MWRAGITTKKGECYAKNFPTKDEAESWVLSISEVEEITKSIVANKDSIKEREITLWE